MTWSTLIYLFWSTFVKYKHINRKVLLCDITETLTVAFHMQPFVLISCVCVSCNTGESNGNGNSVEKKRKRACADFLLSNLFLAHNTVSVRLLIPTLISILASQL